MFRLGGAIETGKLSNAFTANYRNGYTDAATVVRNVGTNKNETIRLNVPAYYTLDWQGRYIVSPEFTVRVGLKNVFDKAPPLSLRASSGHQVGFDPRYANPLGRQFYLNGSYKF